MLKCVYKVFLPHGFSLTWRAEHLEQKNKKEENSSVISFLINKLIESVSWKLFKFFVMNFNFNVIKFKGNN